MRIPLLSGLIRKLRKPRPSGKADDPGFRMPYYDERDLPPEDTIISGYPVFREGRTLLITRSGEPVEIEPSSLYRLPAIAGGKCRGRRKRQDGPGLDSGFIP